MIKVNNLDKYYSKGKSNEIHVINNSSFELPSTGLISFLGESGSGKTTLLNVLGGLDKASGRIEYDSLSMYKYNMKEMDNFRKNEIGYVFQNYNLLKDETVYENLAIALRLVNVYDKEEQKKRIEYVLKAVGMFKYRKKRANALSGGQQQRVSIARALVKKSSIIIADEPTGNLDYENTITVMNILKRISNNTLVLMVTHNIEIAEAYSNQIFKVSDGRIVDSYIPSGGSISNESSNNLYLKDLKHDYDEGRLCNISFYGDNSKKPNLRIIERNGSYYIDSDVDLKLLEDSGLKAVDKHFEAQEVLKNDEIIYDNSFFKNDTKNHHFFSGFIDNVKASYRKMKSDKRRTKALYISFIFIGILFAISVISLSNFLVVDISDYPIDNSYSSVSIGKDTSYLDFDNIISKSLEEDAIYDLQSLVPLDISFNIKESYNQQRSLKATITAISYTNDSKAIIKGKEIANKNDMVISKGLADHLIKVSEGFFTKREELLGLPLSYTDDRHNGMARICGINDNKYKIAYMSDETYLGLLEENTNNLGALRGYEEENLYNKSYHIVEGRDINPSSGADEILVSSSSGYSLNSTIEINEKSYLVVGFYEFNSFKSSKNDLILSTSIELNNKLLECNKSYLYKDIDLVEGNLPGNNNEAIVSIYSGYKVGDTVSFNANSFKVAGIFNGDSSNINDILLTRDRAVASQRDYKYFFKVKNTSLANEIVNQFGASIDNIENINLKASRAYQFNSLVVYGMFSGVLLLLSTVFIFFIMKSRMINEIYTIGVYRSIGGSRGRIYKKYVFDIVVLVTLTSLIGYLGTNIIYQTLSSALNNVFEISNMKNSILLTIGGCGLLYLFALAFGLLPIYMLMKKTPAEILSKYDI